MVGANEGQDVKGVTPRRVGVTCPGHPPPLAGDIGQANKYGCKETWDDKKRKKSPAPHDRPNRAAQEPLFLD